MKKPPRLPASARELLQQAISTFALPYLSPRQLELIGNFPMLTVFREDEEIVRQVSRHYGGYVRFIG